MKGIKKNLKNKDGKDRSVALSLQRLIKKSGRPAITFVVPAYNAEHTVLDALSSIVNNMEHEDELTVVDDCSTDKTYHVVDKFRLNNRDKIIKVIKHSFNKGDGAARNTAIEVARNELIFTLDADNVLAPKSIGPLAKKLLNEKADFAAFEEQRYFKENFKTNDIVWKYPTKARYDLAYHLSHLRVPSASGNYLFTKSAWTKCGRQPEYASGLNNWGFGLAQGANNTKTVILPKSYYYHRHGHESLWMRDENNNKIWVYALQLIIPYLYLIEDKDVEYILSKEGRKSWFYDIDKRPIHLKHGQKLIDKLPGSN